MAIAMPPPHPFLWKIFSPISFKYFVYKNPGRNEKRNHIDIEIYLVALWNMKCYYCFLFVTIIMSAAINKCYWYCSIILPTSVFSFDCSIKIWLTHSCASSVMHSTITFEITVSNNRVSCRPHLDHIAAAVIVTRARCCLTAADHCYVMLGTIKFVY